MKRFINMVPGFITPLLGIYIALQGLSKPDTPTFTRSISMIVLLVSITWILLRIFLELKSLKESKS
jgi:hypothetical protein